MNSKNLLSEDGYYLIAGGNGALGQVVARSLIQQGAKHIGLIGRSEISSQVTTFIGENKDIEIDYLPCDIGDAVAVSDMIAKIESSRAPIKGVFHCAGVLEDAALVNVSADGLKKVLRPKVNGAVNLMTAINQSQLDVVVFFSSAASVLGSPGQASYMAANSFLDSYSYYLQSQGVSAMSINWGPWDNTGMTEDKDVQDSLY